MKHNRVGVSCMELAHLVRVGLGIEKICVRDDRDEDYVRE
jgi:hypothetical protein